MTTLLVVFPIAKKSTTKLVAENNGNLFSPNVGGQKSEIKVPAGLVPSGGSKGAPVACLFPTFWWMLAILGAPWLVDASLQSLPLSSHSLLSVFVLFSLQRTCLCI